MIHTYNGILINKGTRVLICSKADGYGWRNAKFSEGQKIDVPTEKAKVGLSKFTVGSAVVLSFNETGFINFVSVRAYDQKEMAVEMYNVRVVSAKSTNPITKDVPENVQGLGLVHVAIATCAQSSMPVDKIPFDMSLNNAKALVEAFRSEDVHLQVIDSKKAIVIDNRGSQVAAAAAVNAVKVPPRYDPMASDGFYLSPEGKAVLSAMIYGIETGVFKNANLLLQGASGNGKTSLAYILAKVLGWNIVKVSPANISEPEQFFGYMEMTNATTTFQHTDFSRGITTPNTVVLIDELNRAHSSVANGIFNALDDTREVTVKGTTLKVAPNVIFVATINLGSQYAGTFSTDWALMNRFNWRLEMGYMPFNSEVEVLVKKAKVSQSDAKMIVRLAERIRTAVGDRVDMSHRTTLALAYARMTGLPLRSAIEFSFIQGLDPDTKKSVVEMVNAEVGWGTFDPINSIVGNIF